MVVFIFFLIFLTEVGNTIDIYLLVEFDTISKETDYLCCIWSHAQVERGLGWVVKNSFGRWLENSHPSENLGVIMKEHLEDIPLDLSKE